MTPRLSTSAVICQTPKWKAKRKIARVHLPPSSTLFSFQFWKGEGRSMTKVWQTFKGETWCSKKWTWDKETYTEMNRLIIRWSTILCSIKASLIRWTLRQLTWTKWMSQSSRTMISTMKISFKRTSSLKYMPIKKQRVRTCFQTKMLSKTKIKTSKTKSKKSNS